MRGNLREYFAPIAGAGVQGLRRLVRRGRRAWRRAGRRSTRAAAARRARPRVPRPRPRARVLRHLGRVAVGRADLRRGPALHRREPVAARPDARALRRAPAARSSFGVDHDVYRPRPVAAAATTRSSSTPRTSRRGAPSRSACWRCQELHAPPARRCASCCSATREPIDDAVPVRAPRHRHARASSPGRTPRRPSGSALSLTNYSLIPQEMLACGLPCVDLAGDSAGARVRRRRPGGARAARPGRARRRAAERLLDDRRCERARSRGGAARSSPTRPGTTPPTQVEAGLRDALRAARGAARGARARPRAARSATATRARCRRVPGPSRPAGD